MANAITKIKKVLTGLANRPQTGKLVGPQYGMNADEYSGFQKAIATAKSYYDLNGEGGPGGAEFTPPPPGTYETYRKIANYPTVVLALEKLIIPMMLNGPTIKGATEQTPPQLVEVAKQVFLPLIPDLIRTATQAFKFGWYPTEVVYQNVANRIDPVSIRVLDIDKTEYVADEQTNEIVGVKNRDNENEEAILPMNSFFSYVCQSERGDPYGFPLLESTRLPWSNAIQVLERDGRYICKIAGVIWMLHYPSGTGRIPGGAELANEWIARKILKDLTGGKNVRIPNKFAGMAQPGENVVMTAALMEKALQLAGKSDWVVDCFKPEGANFCEGFIDTLKYYDELIVRSIGLPDRSVLPAQRNSRSDSQMHDNTADMLSQWYYTDILNQWVKSHVNRWLVYNFGPGAVGQLLFEPPPLSVENSDSIIKILTAAIGNADLAPEIASTIDFGKAFSDIHFPTNASAAATLKDRLMLLAQEKSKQRTAPPPIFGTTQNGEKSMVNQRMNGDKNGND